MPLYSVFERIKIKIYSGPVYSCILLQVVLRVVASSNVVRRSFSLRVALSLSLLSRTKRNRLWLEI